MIARYTLKNGIPVFIVETNASPVVSIQAWVSRGSAYETPEEAGISHFLEHALFKGTKRRKVGEIASEIESRGGDINAFTSFEETCYYTTFLELRQNRGISLKEFKEKYRFDPSQSKSYSLFIKEGFLDREGDILKLF